MRKRINPRSLTGMAMVALATISLTLGGCADPSKKYNLTEREQKYVDVLTDGPLTRQERGFVGTVSPELEGKGRLPYDEAVGVARKTIDMENKAYRKFGEGFSPF